jgi:dihydropteroate synthase
MEDCLKLLHFHMGSQVTNIRKIKDVLTEAMDKILARDGKDAPPNERLPGSLAAMTASVLNGAHVVRVHDVQAAVEAAKIADEVLRFSN